MGTHESSHLVDGPLYTTAGGHRRFLALVAHAHRAYEAVVASNGEAAEAGDSSVWHDNFAYEENQRQMHQLARRIRDLQDAARRLVVVTPSRAPVRVELGCAVTLEHPDGRRERLVIGGYEDSDPSLRRVACNTPIARSLVGAEPGEERSLPGRPGRTVTVDAVEAAREEEL